jgi:phosphopantetheine adenylyltransferase
MERYINEERRLQGMNSMLIVVINFFVTDCKAGNIINASCQ